MSAALLLGCDSFGSMLMEREPNTNAALGYASLAPSQKVNNLSRICGPHGCSLATRDVIAPA